jgi:transcriptional regulator with XRE-family HTH domain
VATSNRNFHTFLLVQQLAAKEIGARIALARKEAGFTQEELAVTSSFSQRSLSNYESGVSIPYKHLRELSRLLQRPTEWFLYGEEEPDETVSEQLAEIVARLERIEQLLASGAR